MQNVLDWRPCPGAIGFYEVSSAGHVRRIAPSNRSFVGKVLKPAANQKGYLYVCLCLAGKTKTGWVHRLVCEAFHGPPPTEKHQAAHRNGVKSNNSAANLYWATQLENMADRAQHGDAPRGERCGMAKLTEADVARVKKMRAAGMVQRAIGEELGVAPHTISRILSGKRWGHLSDPASGE